MRRSLFTNAAIGLLTIAIVIGAFASFQRTRSSFERIDFAFTRANCDIDFSYKVLQFVEEIATIFLPPLALHFFLLFPRPVLRSKRMLALLYLPAMLLALWNIDLLIFNNAVRVADVLWSLDLIQRWEM